MEVKAIA